MKTESLYNFFKCHTENWKDPRMSHNVTIQSNQITNGYHSLTEEGRGKDIDLGNSNKLSTRNLQDKKQNIIYSN